ncbi:fasciclin domain-containing protein [Aureitalea sp. L0-47]|uniref:fasciclin domain-containing protein n=1 Tax=Aureitalea sp. L0-47 TaxID=2816962 RepID=UPI0022380095|nr:fasciclin domain-containing protein [Aureitalea sp. L0-47]MCW5519314.1 fasciclin domain-containing protein [Aureitalea sp. L0-47]
MRLRYTFLFALISILVITSCKESTDKEVADSDLEVDIEEVVPEEPAEKKPPSVESLRRSNSVMARLMSNGDCKTFASYVVSAELSEVLLNGEGPITVFAPSDAAIAALGEETTKDLLNSESKALMSSAVRTHVVEGNYDSVTITQALKQGRVNLTSLSGEKLSVTRSGNNIYITDSKGNKAKVGKSDINGTNGVVHVVDAFLGLD